MVRAQSFRRYGGSHASGSDDMDTISVVIAVRNGERTIQRAVRGVLLQRSPATEVIVVDDRSGDDTKQRVAELASDQVAVLDGSGRGVATARNLGIRTATARWVAFLDGDDYWGPDFLALARHRIASDADAVACFCAATPIDDHGRVIGRHDVRAIVSVEELVTGQVVPTTSATLARRDAINECGGFFEGFRCAAGVEDLDMWWRLAETGRCLGVLTPAATYVVHDDRDSGRSNAALSDLEHDRELVIERLSARGAAPRLVRRARAVMRARTARYWLRAAKPAQARAAARSSLMALPTLDGMASMVLATTPRPLRGAVVQLRRRYRASGSFRT